MNLRHAHIDPTQLVADEKNLLEEWSALIPGFISDGVVDAEKYCKAPIKILVVLKEVNGGSGWDLRDFLRKGGRAQTWNVVARWIQNIFNIDRNYKWIEMEDNNDERRTTVLPYISAINVKKTSGKDVANNKAVLDAAVRDKAYLKKQIDLYCPDIVICGGTEKPYVKATNTKPKWKMTSRGIWYFVEDSGTIVISYSHPEARTKECMLHYALIDAVREILAHNDSNTEICIATQFY